MALGEGVIHQGQGVREDVRQDWEWGICLLGTLHVIDVLWMLTLYFFHPWHVGYFVNLLVEDSLVKFIRVVLHQ